MSDRIAHGITGTVSGSLISLTATVEKNSDIEIDIRKIVLNIIVGGFGGLFGGVIPDIIEPPLNSHHRKILHSKTIGIILFIGLSYSLAFNKRCVSNSLIESFSSAILYLAPKNN